jgi:hypothetical protein
MNKKNILQPIKILILGLVLSLGVSYVFAALQGAPPTGNVAGPLNEGPSSQVKDGGLSVNAFEARGDSRFKHSVRVDDFAGTGDRPLCADGSGNVVLCD